MKLIKKYLILLSFLHSQLSLAAPQVCSQDKIDEFKNEYIKLQNVLKADGRNIQFNIKKRVTSRDTYPNEINFKEETEKALFANYQNALIKIQNIYQAINKNNSTKDTDLLISKPEVTNFFKTLDPNINNKPNTNLNINIQTLLNQLKDMELPFLQPKFKLDDKDTYLLENLLVHSQDLICTLDKYKRPDNKLRKQNLEVLKNAPLNKMIESLKKMHGTPDLAFANQDITIKEAVKESLDKMREIVKNQNDCKKKLAQLNIGESIQGCNYGKFIESLLNNDKNIYQFKAILHFINANQRTKDARTNLDWINLQFNQSPVTNCYYDDETKSNYVENLPRINNGRDIDTKNLTCYEGNKLLTGVQCLNGLKFETISGRGDKITPIEGSKIDKVSFKNSEECNNFSLTASHPTKENEKEKEKFKWPSGLACNKENCEIQLGLFNGTDGTFIQNFSNESCIFQPQVEELSQVIVCGPSKSSVTFLTTTICEEKNQILSDDKKSCLDKPKLELSEKACNDKKQILSDDKKSCIPLSKEAKCKKDNDEWLRGAIEDDIGTKEVRTDRFSWNGKECTDKKSKKEDRIEDKKEEASGKEEMPDPVYPDKASPPRFQPINIPTRQVFILPGMP